MDLEGSIFQNESAKGENDSGNFQLLDNLKKIVLSVSLRYVLSFGNFWSNKKLIYFWKIQLKKELRREEKTNVKIVIKSEEQFMTALVKERMIKTVIPIWLLLFSTFYFW